MSKKKKTLLEEGAVKQFMKLANISNFESSLQEKYNFEKDDGDELEEEVVEEGGEDLEESENISKGEKGLSSQGGNGNEGHSKQDGVSNHGAGKSDKLSQQKLNAPKGAKDPGKPLMEMPMGDEEEISPEGEDEMAPEMPPMEEPPMDDMDPDGAMGMEGGDDKESQFKEIVSMLANAMGVEVDVDGEDDMGELPPEPDMGDMGDMGDMDDMDDMDAEMGAEDEMELDDEEPLEETGSQQFLNVNNKKRPEQAMQEALVNRIANKVALRLAKKMKQRKK